MKHFIIATAGHVDHGKSALVKALTGTDPDRLPEEKARQITIDLGFAELNLPGPNGEKFHAGIVDVPGHEDFVRNMIAGFGAVDVVLLVVAADDGWMPQTEEHLQILTYLGVSRLVVALTKSDLGGVEETALQIRDQLRDTKLAESPVVPISVRTGDGLEQLKRTLTSLLSGAEPQRDIGKPRLFVDRAFTLRGIGTVVTGTLTGGQLGSDQAVVVQPRGLPARIRSIQSHNRHVDLVQPGMRTAINLPDLKASDSKRGDIVTIADFRASDTLDVLLERSPRVPPKHLAKRPLKNGALIYLHHGTARVRAKIALLEQDVLQSGEQAIAQLRLSSPILAFLGDRFVIRDPSEQQTLAGGIVLDPDGDRDSFRNAAQVRLLTTRVGAYDDVDLCVASEITARGALPRSNVLHKSRFTTGEVDQVLERLHAQEQIFLNDQIAAEVGLWRRLRSRAIELIDQAHKTQPERAGFELNELRVALRDQIPDVIEALVTDLCAADFVRTRSTIARRSHRSALPIAMQPIAEGIRKKLSEKPFDPPARKQIAADTPMRDVLRFLIEQGEAIDIAPEVVLLREAFAQMKTTIVAFLEKNGAATVSNLRQELGTSRRIIVPLLEYLDRANVTHRVGDRRQLSSKTVSNCTLK
jgi:selenocysteine-specific elongation factor